MEFSPNVYIYNTFATSINEKRGQRFVKRARRDIREGLEGEERREKMMKLYYNIKK